MGVESSEDDSDNAPACRHEASRRRNTGSSSSDDEADDVALVFSGAVGGRGKQLQSEENSAEHALDAVAQLTALVQVFISLAQRDLFSPFSGHRRITGVRLWLLPRRNPKRLNDCDHTLKDWSKSPSAVYVSNAPSLMPSCESKR